MKTPAKKTKKINKAEKLNKEVLPRWDFSALYLRVDDPKIAADVARSKKLVQAFARQYAGKVATLDGAQLGKAIAQLEQISDLMGKISSYAQLVYAQDMSQPAHVQLYQNMQEQLTEISSQILFFTLELNRIPERTLQAQLKDKTARHYAPWIRDSRAFAPYQLADELERLLHEKSVTGRAAWNRLFDETIAAMRFTIRGKELTEPQAMHLLSDRDGEVRKDAAHVIGEAFAAKAPLFSFITNTLAKDKEIEDRWRKFPRPISSRNISNYIEDEVVEALIQSVKKRYKSTAHRYYTQKAKWLGGKTLEYWDRNAPLPFDSDRTYAWKDACELVSSAYHTFSPTLGGLVDEFFDKNWIDAAPAAGKSPGAFAHPCVPSAHPFILMNFMGKARDVMTLAHELGHGVHQVLSARQGALMADTPLTLAETASVFGEQLTFRAMLERENKPQNRKALIASKVEDMLNTVVRQVAFCEFERAVHDERKRGEVPTTRLCEIWMQVQGEALGPAVKLHGNYRYFWSYIPHFIHSPFYVYAYAFGDCLVNSLYANYEKTKQKSVFEKKYLAMLQAGGTLRHKELLAPFGLDASKPSFWGEGLDLLEGWIDQLDA